LAEEGVVSCAEFQVWLKKGVVSCAEVQVRDTAPHVLETALRAKGGCLWLKTGARHG
jgi:hypothetical protein